MYASTIDELGALAHDALAPPLPLHDQSARPSDHADAVAGAVPRDAELVVVAQSLGAFTGPLVEVFLHDVDPAVARENECFQGVPGEGMFAEPWPLDAWPEVPTRVLAPTDDRLFPRDFQRRVASERLGLEIDEMAGGHLPMLSSPRELAERLVALT